VSSERRGFLTLEHLRVNTLILTGIAANICVLFTANEIDLEALLQGRSASKPANHEESGS